MIITVYYFDWDWNVCHKDFNVEHEAFEFMRKDPDCMYIYHITKEYSEVEE